MGGEVRAKDLRPGDVLIGLSPNGHVSVVRITPNADDSCRLTLSRPDGSRYEINARAFQPSVRVLRSSW